MSAYQATKFEAGKFYVMTPPGLEWGDYEGPFDTDEQALDYLRQFVNERLNYSPEMLRMVIIQCKEYPDGIQADLAKRDGVVLNGQYLANRL